jgi:hypothetical protein
LDYGGGLVGVCGAVVIQCTDGEECQEDAVDEMSCGRRGWEINVRKEGLPQLAMRVVCYVYYGVWGDDMREKLAII